MDQALVSRPLAVVVIVLAGLDQRVAFGVSTATLVSVALLPVWVQHLQRYRGGWLLMLLAGLAVLNGLLLGYASSSDHVWVLRSTAAGIIGLVTAVFTVGLLLWARGLLPLWLVALAFATGTLLSALPSVPTSDNVWKYQLGVPTAFIVLALLHMRRSLLLTLIGLSALGLAGISQDYRSYFGFCLAAGLLLLWQSAAGPLIQRVGRPVIALSAMVFVAATYWLSTYLLTEGYLGNELQERSSRQVRESGSLIAGGRPEWTGTWSLMADRPLGFGVGVSPNPSDVAIAQEGLARVGVDPANGYVHNYMFGGEFKLHSILADLWVGFGIMGLLLGAAMFVLLLRSLVALLLVQRASALTIFAATIAIWDLIFGPIHSDLPEVAFALGLLLISRGDGTRDTSAAALTQPAIRYPHPALR